MPVRRRRCWLKDVFEREIHIRSEQGTDAVFVAIPGPLLVKTMSQAEGIVRSKKGRCNPTLQRPEGDR
jgi:hypothetical protein